MTGTRLIRLVTFPFSNILSREEGAAWPLGEHCIKCSVNQRAGAELEAQHKPETSVAAPNSNFSKSDP